MEEDLKDVLILKKDNIGGLCLYLRKRNYLIDELDKNFNEELKIKLTLPQKIWCYLNNQNIFCDCGKLKKWKDSKSGWRETCGNNQCIINKRKKTNLLIYGQDNPLKNIEIREKVNKTNLEKYGFEVATKNIEIKKKISEILNNRKDDDKKKSKIKRSDNWKNKNFDEKMNVKINSNSLNFFITLFLIFLFNIYIK